MNSLGDKYTSLINLYQSISKGFDSLREMRREHIALFGLRCTNKCDKVSDFLNVKSSPYNRAFYVCSNKICIKLLFRSAFVIFL